MRRLLLAVSLALIACLLPAWAADDVPQLQKVDEVIGHGQIARNGDTVSVNYTGWLYDAKAANHRGEEFDSTQGAAPIRFTLGANEVIDGWDRGIRGMHVGGKRVLIIPARLAYGNRGVDDAVPPGAALVFEVELVGVQ